MHRRRTAHGEWGRSLTLLPREQQQILEQRRPQQQTDEWKERFDARAGVEDTTNVLCATAFNIIRAYAWLNGTPLGTIRVSHLTRPAHAA